VRIMILAMHNTGQVTGMAGQAQVRLWVVVRGTGEAEQGLMQLAIP
jgi:hypothetical protein